MNTEYIQIYHYHVQTPSDINEHLPTFAKYAQECESVVECGVRSVVSTWGFVKGLVENGKSIKKLIGVDLNYSSNIEKVKQVCSSNQVEYKFVQGNDLHVDIEPADLFFIDTWHIYGHLKRELEKFAPLAKKYILMHDTEIDGIFGETLRVGWDPEVQSKQSGIPVHEIVMGLKPAITEFLTAHPEFRLKEEFKNNNGLTVLERV